MRNSDPIIWYPDQEYNTSLSQKMESNYQDSITQLQEQWLQADYDQRCFLGDTDVWNTLFPDVIHKKLFNFNLVHSSVMMAGGQQRKNRRSTICIPLRSPVQKTADQFTKCLYHVDSQGGYKVYSEAFEQGILVKGFGLISIFPDYGQDPISPDIKLRYVDFNSVLIDPYFRNKDLSDCRYIWIRQYFDREEAKMIYKDHEEFIDNVPFGGSPKDDKFYYMPENYGLNVSKLLAFDEYWYLSTREVTYAVDIQTQETKELDGDEEDIRIVLMDLKDKIKIVKSVKQTVRRAIRVNGQTMVDEERPYGLDRYPFVGCYGNFNPDTPYFNFKFKGLVRDQRDAQFLFDYRKMIDLAILNSQQQGLKVKKGALVTPKDALNTDIGRVLVINEKNDMNDVQPMEIIPPSPVMLQMEDMLKSVMREISGINEEMVGSAIDDKAGVLAMLRQQAGIVTLQKYFDSADEMQTECGNIIIQMIQHFWTYGKVKDVIGEEPTPEFDNKAFFKYGAKVVQGVLTDDQEQLELAKMFELQERFGPIFPVEEIFEAMTIQNKDRILEKVMANQKAQQEQEQKMAELQMQQMQVDNETKLAYAESQKGLAKERSAKIYSDIAVAEDKLKRAQTEDTSSLLNLVKAIKELEGMDIDHIARKLEILEKIQPEALNTQDTLVAPTNYDYN